jgi:ethanolamine phosphate phosphodiesterase
VFPHVEGVKVITSIPGNHDIGLGNGIQPERLDRFKSYFTYTNTTSQILDVCNFEVVLLDTPSLLNTVSPEVYGPPTALISQISDSPMPYARLLFSHIPLYRPPETNCGPDRESSRPIELAAGYQYQNTLDLDLTTKIFDTMWPTSAIFSGDDHDSCFIQHELEGRREKIPEYTIKSFSWAMVFSSLE